MLDTYYALRRLMWQDNPFKLMIQSFGMTAVAIAELFTNTRDLKRMLAIKKQLLDHRARQQAKLVDPKAPQHLHVEV